MTSNRPTILIAEDVESNFLYLKAVLRKLDVDLKWVQNGIEAVEAVKTNTEIVLVLMDLQMPVMNGFESTKQIKMIRPELPVIAQTAFVMPEDIEQATQSGCDDFLAKPIKSRDLLEKIRSYFE